MEVQHLSFLPLSLVSGMVTLAQMRAVGTHTYVCVCEQRRASGGLLHHVLNLRIGCWLANPSSHPPVSTLPDTGIPAERALTPGLVHTGWEFTLRSHRMSSS